MAKSYLLAKIWRWHDNPLLTELTASDELFILADDFSSTRLPFTDLTVKETVFTRKSRQVRESFLQSLKRPYTLINTPEDLRGLKGRELIAYHFFDDYYLQALKPLDVTYQFSHPSHFVPKASAQKALTLKNTFSDFRQKLEAQKIYQCPSMPGESMSVAEAEALKSLDSYLLRRAPDTYLEERNEFSAAKAGTHFSLPLALGTLSPQKILQELQRYEDLHGESKSSYWIKFELLWREFFYFTQLFSQRSLYFVDAKTPTPLPSISLRELLVELCEHELIRAMLGELVTTGVLSNRCRQIFASHFVHLNRFDWRYGAYLFQYFLKDYDPSSNWGNWQYLAGVGRDPRGLRFFNISSQLERYNPDGSYLAQWGNQKDFLAHL